MKKVLLVLVVMTLGVNAQSVKLEMKATGYESAILSFENESSINLYEKSIDWINSIYNSPSEVIQGQVLNKSIVIIGYKSGAFKGAGAVYDIKYRVEMKFKDGRVMYTFRILQSGGKGKMYTWDNNYGFKSNGEARSSKMYVKTLTSLNSFANELLLNYETYIKSDAESLEDDW